MKSETLLFEIGTEELPAGYIDPALNTLKTTLAERLAAARISFGRCESFGTPRRLAVMIHDVALRQADVSETLTGPPVTVAVDENGDFTVPAHKFAEKSGIPVKALKIVTTDKGKYLAADRVEKGRNTTTVLKEILPQILSNLTFPKNMKWGEQTELFARPVHSLLALVGKQIVTFSWAGISSNRYTRGHFFMNNKRIKIDHPDNYLVSLENAHVIADTEKRRIMVAEEINRISAAVGGLVLSDEELIDMVTNMVEFPVAAAGRFEEKYLALPEEVLITAMRSHQKYFTVTDNESRLLSSFIVINNNRATDMSQVTKGHERVLRARLEDAMFFYENDVKIPLANRLDSLKRVLFQARLGSVYDKTQRLTALASALADMAAVDDTGLRTDLTRAARLCKTDLVTQVVIEFPKLQGTMGRVYALANGENAVVSRAIEEHYQPAYSGAPLPESLCGALLAIVDKIDSICGCFAIGLVPSGASDPYALRRQGIGVIQILLVRNVNLSLRDLVNSALQPYSALAKTPIDEAEDAVVGFLRGRMAQLLFDEGVSKDIVNAVLNASDDHIPDVWRRASALSAMKSRPDFEPLAVAFKRVANIIKKTDTSQIGAVDEKRFQHPSERRLYDAYRETAGKVDKTRASGGYEQALVEIAGIRQTVDTFFDDVLVMDKDPALRANRLALLLCVSGLFSGFADFSAIATD